MCIVCNKCITMYYGILLMYSISIATIDLIR